MTFEEWVAHVFDHEVKEKEWYWSTDSDEWCGSSELTVKYLTQLFENPLKYLNCFSDEQIEQGIYYIISSGSEMIYSVKDEEVSFLESSRCVRSFYNLFKDLYDSKC